MITVQWKICWEYSITQEIKLKYEAEFTSLQFNLFMFTVIFHLCTYIYSPFHKTLPWYSNKMQLISVRFYGMGDTLTKYGSTQKMDTLTNIILFPIIYQVPYFPGETVARNSDTHLHRWNAFQLLPRGQIIKVRNDKKKRKGFSYFNPPPPLSPLASKFTITIDFCLLCIIK